jgi:lipopolysaccharide export system permease protein
MKKLIFRKIFKDTTFLFILLSISLGVIVWTLQAVNYLDYVTQDGHGLKTYFLYSIFNFPKIVHRLIPFVFFISLFLIITGYELKNELVIFWTNGITKLKFANKIIYISIILFFFQIFIGSFVSPLFQYKSRMHLKNSDINFFSSLIKEGKFINAVSGLTIFIESKNIDGTFKNIFIDDSSKKNTKMIYARNGKIVDTNNKKIFKLSKGKVINKEKSKINVFEFDKIDFSLSEYSSNTILVPKIQEISSTELIFCSLKTTLKIEIDKKIRILNCTTSLIEEVNQELFKRFYKPIYIPLIAIICSFLIILPKSSRNYKSQSRLIFLFGFLILIFSETTLRYSTNSNLFMAMYIILPWIFFLIIYTIFYMKVKNV